MTQELIQGGAVRVAPQTAHQARVALLQGVGTCFELSHQALQRGAYLRSGVKPLQPRMRRDRLGRRGRWTWGWRLRLQLRLGLGLGLDLQCRHEVPHEAAEGLNWVRRWTRRQ